MPSDSIWRINRIRLEFKGYGDVVDASAISVLIELDWNLKMELPDMKNNEQRSINRIRLEFKV